MPESLLNLPNVSSVVQVIRGERLAETVQSPLLADRIILAVHRKRQTNYTVDEDRDW